MGHCLIEQTGSDKMIYKPYTLSMPKEINDFCFYSGIKRTQFAAMYRIHSTLELLRVFDCYVYVCNETSIPYIGFQKVF